MNMSFISYQIKNSAAKDHGKNYTKDRPSMVCHLSSNRPLKFLGGTYIQDHRLLSDAVSQ